VPLKATRSISIVATVPDIPKLYLKIFFAFLCSALRFILESVNHKDLKLLSVELIKVEDVDLVYGK